MNFSGAAVLCSVVNMHLGPDSKTLISASLSPQDCTYYYQTSHLMFVTPSTARLKPRQHTQLAHFLTTCPNGVEPFWASALDRNRSLQSGWRGSVDAVLSIQLLVRTFPNQRRRRLRQQCPGLPIPRGLLFEFLPHTLWVTASLSRCPYAGVM